jgi:hypothetical protein
MPYLKTGLEQGEGCLWITSPPLSDSDAINALVAAIPEAAQHRARGRLEIIASPQWYTSAGTFDHQQFVEQWMAKVHWVGQQGLAGIRVIGTDEFLSNGQAEQFGLYERQARDSMRHERSLSLWAYPAAKFTPDRMLEVIQDHSHALLRTPSQKWTLTAVTG